MEHEIIGNPGTNNCFEETHVKHSDNFYNHVETIENNYYHKGEVNTVGTIITIWEKIVDVEHFLLFDIKEQINDAVSRNCIHIDIDPNIIKTTRTFIKKKRILLPTPVAEAAEYVINYCGKLYNSYLSLINQAARREVTLAELNRYVPEQLNNEAYLRQKQILESCLNDGRFKQYY